MIKPFLTSLSYQTADRSSPQVSVVSVYRGTIF